MKLFMKKRCNSGLKICIKMKYLLILFVLFSCSAQKISTTSSFSENNSNSSVLELLLNDNYSGLKSPQILILKEPSTLQDFYSQINKTRKPGIAIPAIDFNKEMVIIYCSGEHLANTSTKIAIDSENKEQVVFKVITSKTAIESTVLTSPFSVYKLNRTSKEFKFKR